MSILLTTFEIRPLTGISGDVRRSTTSCIIVGDMQHSKNGKRITNEVNISRKIQFDWIEVDS